MSAFTAGQPAATSASRTGRSGSIADRPWRRARQRAPSPPPARPIRPRRAKRGRRGPRRRLASAVERGPESSGTLGTSGSDRGRGLVRRTSGGRARSPRRGGHRRTHPGAASMSSAGGAGKIPELAESTRDRLANLGHRVLNLADGAGRPRANSPRRPRARATSARTSGEVSSRCPRSGETASTRPLCPIACAAARRTCGSGSPRTRPSATTLRSVGAPRMTSHAARRRRASPSASQGTTRSPARGIRKPTAAEAARRRTSTSAAVAHRGLREREAELGRELRDPLGRDPALRDVARSERPRDLVGDVRRHDERPAGRGPCTSGDRQRDRRAIDAERRSRLDT